ncbi:MAG TPA: PRC-barrel domain-containing protein [Tepidisphaeraceae bacterium]|nr:PRC-barrel domain-containing protein [Tepidisphaeraceae bacterium]
MKQISKYCAAIALAVGPVAWCQQQPADTKTEKITSSMQKMDEQHQMVHLQRAYSMLGMNVYNEKGEKLGEINDLVLNGGQNQISYAVLSYGGVLGIGDKLFAIPWSMLEHKSLEKDRVFLNVDTDKLAKAPGFNKKQWPDAADTAYWNEVSTYYRSGEAVPARAEVPPNMSPGIANINGNVRQEKGIAWSRKVSAVIGADVKNQQDESLGDINDLVLDTNTGKVQYAVLSFGGWLGMGDKLFAVPIQSLQTASGKETFILNVSKDRLKTAPGFAKKAWPDFADQTFWGSVDTFYGQNQTTR